VLAQEFAGFAPLEQRGKLSDREALLEEVTNLKLNRPALQQGQALAAARSARFYVHGRRLHWEYDMLEFSSVYLA
jgi:hypothetical protein